MFRPDERQGATGSPLTQGRELKRGLDICRASPEMSPLTQGRELKRVPA